MNVIGQYQIEKILGTGGMGKVYAVTHSQLDTLHAIKVLHDEFGKDPDFLTRFGSEAKLMSGLGTHPHILKVDDFRKDDEGISWMRMPLIDGIAATGKEDERWVTLGDRMAAEGIMDLEIVSTVIDQLLDAVEFAHKKGVLHCDLKPENILLTDAGILVSDFGLARVMDPELLRSRIEQSVMESMSGNWSRGSDDPMDLGDIGESVPAMRESQAKALVGTLAYMAPELKPPKMAEQTEGSDLYAVGLIAYQMLTGEKEPEFGKLLSDFRQDVDEKWDRWFAQSIARDPKGRFANAGAMRSAWGELTKAAPVAKKEEPSVPPAKKAKISRSKNSKKKKTPPTLAPTGKYRNLFKRYSFPSFLDNHLQNPFASSQLTFNTG